MNETESKVREDPQIAAFFGKWLVDLLVKQQDPASNEPQF